MKTYSYKAIIFGRNKALRSVLGDKISVPGNTRWLSQLQSLKNIPAHANEISTCLNNNLYVASKLKPKLNAIIAQRATIEAMVQVLEAIQKPLVKLQVI
jgi:hypothetical protein